MNRRLQRRNAQGAQSAQPSRQIRGPHSALTDFLASQNIDANQIRRDAEARRAATAAVETSTAETASADPEGDTSHPPRRVETKAQERKRKKENEKALAKIKESKNFKRDHGQLKDDEANDKARELFQTLHTPDSGQRENCELCKQPFTVTTYTKSGPRGGLLCRRCAEKVEKENPPTKKRKAPNKIDRRQKASALLEGVHGIGAKALVKLCLDTISRNADMLDDLGDLRSNEPMMEKIAAILSKNRRVDRDIFNLFLQPNLETVICYDGAKLKPEDYERIFQIVPRVKHLTLRNAVQFKNRVMEYLTESPTTLETFCIFAANLIDDEHWNNFFVHKGATLKTFKIYWTDGHFGDDQLAQIVVSCPLLIRLKISHNQKVTDTGIKALSGLKNLEHLTLRVSIPTTSSPYTEILKSIGPNLKTLKLDAISKLEDDLLDSIKDNCRRLARLRLHDNETFYDDAFQDMFTDWENTPLVQVDFSKCRHVDAQSPLENKDGIGFGDLGLTALLAHSGSTIRKLNIMACRHITTECLERVFGPDCTYPHLEEFDISFVWGVTDFVVASIFKSCPKLKTLKVFGNMKLKDVRVPRGKILVGMPNALGMQLDGDEEQV